MGGRGRPDSGSCPGRLRGEPARSQAAGRGLKPIPAPAARGGRAGKRDPPPQSLCASAPRCVQHLCPPGHDPEQAAARLRRLPRLERDLTHRGVLPSAWGPVGFLRRVSCSERERKRVSSGRRGDSYGSTRGAPGPTSARASERRAPAAAAVAPK